MMVTQTVRSLYATNVFILFIFLVVVRGNGTLLSEDDQVLYQRAGQTIEGQMKLRRYRDRILSLNSDLPVSSTSNTYLALRKPVLSKEKGESHRLLNMSPRETGKARKEYDYRTGEKDGFIKDEEIEEETQDRDDPGPDSETNLKYTNMYAIMDEKNSTNDEVSKKDREYLDSVTKESSFNIIPYLNEDSGIENEELSLVKQKVIGLKYDVLSSLSDITP